MKFYIKRFSISLLTGIKTLVFGTVLMISIENKAQKVYPQNYFTSPMEIPLMLAGTFGELRSGHFHSGIDIKTQEKTGLNVLAVADGWVSRIKVSPVGYGLALYITHPNGYTSVYAHLEAFNNEIDSIVKEIQYERRNYEIDFYPKRNQIQVQKSEIIGKSGNSGSSGGPHLHFEIRNSREIPINPLNFGIKVQDNIPPKIKSLRIYEYSGNYNDLISSEFTNGNLKNLESDTIEVPINFYFGVNAFDLADGAPNENGLYKFWINLDGNKIFGFTANEVSFDEKRMINSYIDYPTYYKSKQWFQTNMIMPANYLSMYDPGTKKGYLNLDDSLVHEVEIYVSDFNGNSTKVMFKIKKTNKPTEQYIEPETTFYSWSANKLMRNDLYFETPPNALYQNAAFAVLKFENEFNKYSAKYDVGNPAVPLEKYCKIRIKATENLTIDLQPKAAIASIEGKSLIWEGGTYSNGWVETKTRSFGRYMIVVDTIAPKITPVNITENLNIDSSSILEFKIFDDFSGIKNYNGFVDEKWVLCQYDEKTQRILFHVDEHYSIGNHLFTLEVSDQKNNKSTYQFKFQKL